MSTRQRSRSGRLLLALVAVLVGTGLLLPAPARAADATMTFTGELNLAGLLSAITVQPTSVTIPADGAVAFANATTVTLTVTVGGKSVQLAPNGSSSMLFTGAAEQEVFLATATSLNIPLVGTLTSSVGKVVVQARPAAAGDPTQAPPAPASPGNGAAPTEEPSWPASASPTIGASGQPRGAVIPLAPGTSPSPGGSSKSSASRVDPSGSTVGGNRSGPRERADGHTRPGHLSLKKRKVVAEPVLPPFPGFSTRADQIGLVVLLAAAVVTGLGAALIRTVLAYRPLVLVGAHSQAARRARRLRRGR